jgi:small subunit ribosomal protein S8
MPVTDPIADMLAIIKTGIMAHKEDALVKRSRITENILAILKREGFISNFKAIEDKRQGLIKVYFKGRRVYVKTKDIRQVYGGIGVALISTPAGVMTGKEAREKNLGGEILCHVW